MNLIITDSSSISIDLTVVPVKGSIQWPVIEPKHHKLIDVRSLKYWEKYRPFLLGPQGFRDIVVQHLDLCKLYAPSITNLVPSMSTFVTSMYMRKFLRAIQVLDRCCIVYTELEMAAATCKPPPFVYLKQLCPEPDFEETLPGFSEAKIKAFKKDKLLCHDSSLFSYKKRNDNPPSFKAKNRFVCHFCHQPGHIKKHCPKNTKRDR